MRDATSGSKSFPIANDLEPIVVRVWLSRVAVDAIHTDQIREQGGLPGLRDENGLAEADFVGKEAVVDRS